jgi:hypothetical protein
MPVKLGLNNALHVLPPPIDASKSLLLLTKSSLQAQVETKRSKQGAALRDEQAKTRTFPSPERVEKRGNTG